MRSHEKPDALLVTLSIAQERGSTLRCRPPCWTSPHGMNSWWPQSLAEHTRRLMKKSELFIGELFFSFFRHSCSSLAKHVHPVHVSKVSWFLAWALDRFHDPFASITFLISTNPFPLDFEIPHLYTVKSSSRISEPLINPWRNRTLQRGFLLWLYPPPVLHCLHEHSALARSQTTAKLSPNIALLPYVPFSPRLYVCLPISRPQSRTCSGDKHTISSPDMFNILCTVSLQSRPVPMGYNTRLHAYSNSQCLSIFHLQTCRTNGDRYGRRRSEERRTGNVSWEDSGLEMREV